MTADEIIRTLALLAEDGSGFNPALALDTLMDLAVAAHQVVAWQEGGPPGCSLRPTDSDIVLRIQTLRNYAITLRQWETQHPYHGGKDGRLYCWIEKFEAQAAELAWVLGEGPAPRI